MGLLSRKRTNGFVHTVDTALALSDERANLLCVSDRTLYLLQNLSELDIGFLNRYALNWEGNLYQPVEPGSEEEEDIILWTGAVQRELLQMSCEDFTINVNVPASACGCQPPGQDSIVPPPPMGQGEAPPEGWKEMENGSVDKCKMAYLLRDQLEAVFGQMDTFGVATLFGGTVATTQALIATILIEIAGGPILWALTTLGAISGIVATVISFEIDFAALKQITIDRASDLICAFYDAGDPDDAWTEARLIFVDEGATAGELAFFDALQTIRAAALLFFLPDPGSEDWQAILDALPTQDCATCAGGTPGAFRWAIKEGVEMGTGEFRYDGEEFTISAVINPETGYYRLQALARDPDGLGGWENCTNWDMVMVSTTITDPEVGWGRSGNCRSGGTEGECDGSYPQSWSTNGTAPDPDTQQNNQQFLWDSEFAFSVTYKINGVDEGGCP